MASSAPTFGRTESALRQPLHHHRQCPEVLFLFRNREKLWFMYRRRSSSRLGLQIGLVLLPVYGRTLAPVLRRGQMWCRVLHRSRPPLTTQQKRPKTTRRTTMSSFWQDSPNMWRKLCSMVPPPQPTTTTASFTVPVVLMGKELTTFCALKRTR